MSDFKHDLLQGRGAGAPLNLRNILYFSLALLFASLIVWKLYPKALPVEIHPARMGQFRNSLQKDCKIRATTRVLVSARESGTLQGIQLKVGDTVHSDQSFTELIAEYTNSVETPISGVVSKVFRTKAGPVLRDEPLIEIIKLESLAVVIEPADTNDSSIKPGMPVKVEGWGGEPLTATITRSPRAKNKTDTTEMAARINAPPPSLLEKLGDDLTARCTIFLGTEEDALIIPTAALFMHNNRWAVYKNADGKAKLTFVQVVAQNKNQTQIAFGLEQNDEVIINPTELIKDGTRVQDINKMHN